MKNCQILKRNKLLIIALICLLLFGISCNSKIDFEEIKIGMSKVEVLNVVGKPLKKNNAVLPLEPFWGPQEAMDSTKLNEKREYEEWTYKKSENIYLVWFGGSNSVKNEWKVIGKTSYPEGVVF